MDKNIDIKCDLNCDECMEHGKMFLLCCKKECGTHDYCRYCTRLEIYTGESK